MRVRRTVLAAVAAGVAVGAVAAATIPTSVNASGDGPFLAPLDPLTIVPQRRRERGPITDNSVYLRARPGTLHDEVRQHDPAGGPDWVVRVFDADRMIPKAIRRPGSDGAISVALCAQLGRELHGQFGWIDGDNRFRRVSTAAFTGTPALCTSRRLGAKRQPHLSVVTLVDRPRASDARVRGTVAWGLTGREANAVTITAQGKDRRVRHSRRHGAYLSFFGSNRRTAGTSIHVRYRGGGTALAAQWPYNQARAFPNQIAGTDDAVLPDSTQRIARAADPAGGPSWGLLGVRTTRGLWCLGTIGNLLGDRVGELDADLGVLHEKGAEELPYGCDRRTQPTSRNPVQLVSMSNSEGELPVLSPLAGPLRLMPGRSAVYGRTLSTVTSLTVNTPGGVRTVIPSGPAHGFLVVEGGGWLGGTTRVTAHLADGSTKVATVDGGLR